ncbi:Uncharacterised protein [Mycobacteroides abscessus subsp. bolletii]|nr:Uncharacterised protein [Mycobacteroides abscessus subsp. bolletii]SKP94266.1 Uncharacterised protein [Mycobacteroides abscessus subsp. bolletii]SKQ21311.1 Uncharacterised protein [Mycobacteroides abscessus subsp. bolletii]SKQ28438.1 Uncharacterised protein [Mycobacteroides abscessus subsp. bolletii]
MPPGPNGAQKGKEAMSDHAKPSRQSMARGQRDSKDRGFAAITVAVGLYVAAVGGGPALIFWLFAENRDWGEFWRVAAGPTGTMLAAAGAVLAAYLALHNGERSRRQDRDSTDRDRRAATERDLRTRFTSAAEQLGDERINVRQAGAYAMAGIADDWLTHAANEPMGSREAQVCIDVLCAALRDTQRALPLDKAGEPADQPVRTVIVHIAALHLRHDAEPSWRNLRFDLAGAYLHNVNFSQCHFDGSLTLADARFAGQQADFTGSHFSNTTFDRAEFQLGTTAEFTHTIWKTLALFKRTVFGGSLDFDHSQFYAGANYSSASIGTAAGHASTASFQKVGFSGTADFSYMDAYCSMTFYKATFIGPADFRRLNSAKPEHDGSVSFQSATFHGPAEFEYCQIGGLADFRKTIFLGTRTTPTTLDEAFFDGEEAVRFVEAKFFICEFGGVWFEREVSFYHTEFSTEAPFRRAVFAAPVRFEYATFKNGATFREVEFRCGADFYRVNFGDRTVDFTDPTIWNDIRVDWDGTSPFPTSRLTQPPNVLPADWPPQAISQSDSLTE